VVLLYHLNYLLNIICVRHAFKKIVGDRCTVRSIIYIKKVYAWYVPARGYRYGGVDLSNHDEMTTL
jgi:hypothetical protein